MNERARGALVTAALNGVPQIKELYRWGPGRCAIGVLLDEFGLSEREGNTVDVLAALAGLSSGEFSDIMEANDLKGWDFLTIARKIGTDECSPPSTER
jgi:hypothetical protein